MKKQTLLFTVLFAFLAAILIAGGCSKKEVDRWYLPSQVEAGRVLFQDHCAACHGDNGEGAKDWREPLPDGTHPPPPLNGSGHTWHHSLSPLKLTISAGGEPWGGVMPDFEGTLSDQQIDAVIAYFQSQWPPEIYQKWVKHGGLEK